MEYWNTALSIAGLAIGLGIAFIRFRSETDNESARLWRENAEAEKARGDRLEGTIRDLTARVERLETENGLLRSLVTGERAIQDLSVTVTTYHREAMAALSALRGSVRAVETRKGPAGPASNKGPS
ncbi:hypothetical protein [Kitasatospora sp. MBT66]|uniref:hypothetical protein n=1 Tax=Kitasatospora sp. MBT66 TaxID=1444769 RepID=UPI0005BDA83E|nr:hypothetical protein [Kitasatospora sp. MBT66]